MSSRSSSRGRRGLQSWTQRWITSSASGIESLQKLSPLSSFDPSIPWTFLAFHFPNFVPSWRSSLVLTHSVTNIVNLGQFSRDHCWVMSSAAFNLKESRLTLVEPVIMAASYSSQFWQKRTLVHQKFLTKGTKIWARNKSINPHSCWPRHPWDMSLRRKCGGWFYHAAGRYCSGSIWIWRRLFCLPFLSSLSPNQRAIKIEPFPCSCSHDHIPRLIIGSWRWLNELCWEKVRKGSMMHNAKAPWGINGNKESKNYFPRESSNF